MTVKKIHYAWEGSAISKDHAANMLLTVATAAEDVEVTVWTTRPMSVIATLNEMKDDDGTSPGSAAHRHLAYEFAKFLKIGHTRSLYARLPAYLPEPGKAVRVAAIFEREISGPYRNYAAASDWTRVVLMLVEGGTYADVDVLTNNPGPLLLQPHQPDFLVWNPIAIGGLPNGLMAARPGSATAKKLLENMLAALAGFDKLGMRKPWHDCPPSWGSKRSNLIKNINNLNGLPLALPDESMYGRQLGTMRTSGPSVLFNLGLHTDGTRLFPSDATVFHRITERINHWYFDRHAAQRTILNTLVPEGVRADFDASSNWQHPPRRRRASTPALHATAS